jgi:hypothetical protein
MSASDANSPQQFKLFMTGKEWKEQVTHSTDGPIASIWADKSARAAQPSTVAGEHGTGVRSSIERYGYQHDRESPPTIIIEQSPSGKSTRFVQSEGHHRVASAADIEEETGNPVYIPTNYVDNTPSGRAARGAPRGVRRIHGANALQRSGEAGDPTK